MYKYLALILIVVLGAYVGFKYFTDEKIDARESVNKGIEQVKRQRPINAEEEKLLRLQLAVVSYIAAKGTPPHSLDELVPEYLDRVPEDPATGQRYAYTRTGNKYFIGQQTKVSSQDSVGNMPAGTGVRSQGGDQLTMGGQFINPNTMVEEEFIYDPAGKRDPFLPFDVSVKEDKPSDLPPLERYKLGQLRLTAVIADLDGNLKGNVEDEQGKGYLVKPGTKIGDNGGVAVKIESDRIKILETQRDLLGNETSKVIEMVIQKKSK